MNNKKEVIEICNRFFNGTAVEEDVATLIAKFEKYKKYEIGFSQLINEDIISVYHDSIIAFIEYIKKENVFAPATLFKKMFNNRIINKVRDNKKKVSLLFGVPIDNRVTKCENRYKIRLEWILENHEHLMKTFKLIILGYNQKEISDKLGVAVSTIKKRYSRIKQLLKGDKK